MTKETYRGRPWIGGKPPSLAEGSARRAWRRKPPRIIGPIQRKKPGPKPGSHRRKRLEEISAPVNELERYQAFRALGATPEQAADLTLAQREGELVVVWCDRLARTLGACEDPGEMATHTGSWDDFVPRYCGPVDTSSSVSPGDFVRPRVAP